jgi:hypothetical protein
VSEEGSQELLIVLDGPGVVAGGGSDLVKLEEGEVGQRVELEEGPEVLDRVELGSVRGKKLGMEARGGIEHGSDSLGSMGLKTIPDHDQRSGHVTMKDAEELHHLGGSNVAAGVQAKVQLDSIPGGRNGKGRQGGVLLVRSSPLQEHRRVAARCPAPTHQGSHQEAAFVEEDEASVESLGFS